MWEASTTYSSYNEFINKIMEDERRDNEKYETLESEDEDPERGKKRILENFKSN